MRRPSIPDAKTITENATRVSMGTVFLVPWAWIDNPIPTLHSLGFMTVAMALTDNALSITSPILHSVRRLAIILGTEGDGLPPQTIAASDYVAKIPMHHSVDSPNVAAASALAFWELGKKR